MQIRHLQKIHSQKTVLYSVILLFAHYLQWPRVRVSSCYEENNFEPCLTLGINLLVAIEKCLTRLVSVREA